MSERIPKALSTIFRGWALAERGQLQDGMAELQRGLAASRATGAEVYGSLGLGLLAEIQGKAGQVEAGLTSLVEAIAFVDRTAERFYEAELYRLKGALLLQQSQKNDAEAEECFRKAIEVAQKQQAKSWELRAATSLARLWQGQGKTKEARELLAPIYNWFTEGFETADLKDAKALLDELSS